MIFLHCVIFAQESPRAYLINKGNLLLEEGNSDQARYYYLLAIKQKGEAPTDEEIKSKVIQLDSTIAYESLNEEFVDLLKKADSLLKMGAYIEALKFFDDANGLEPVYDYPHGRIDQIIETSESIKKQLLIYNAKQNQMTYHKMQKDIEQLENGGFEIEAYFKYREFARAFHQDSSAILKSETLYSIHKDEIELLKSHVQEGEQAYQNGEFNLAKTLFEKALLINPLCGECEYRLEQIDFCIAQEIKHVEDFAKNLTNAKEDFKTGKYQKAYYQFYWLQKQKPDHIEIATYINKLEELMEAETDERMRKFNADITLEKANEAFLSGDFEKALSNYLKIKNAYLNVVDYAQFVELRIAECLNELED